MAKAPFIRGYKIVDTIKCPRDGETYMVRLYMGNEGRSTLTTFRIINEQLEIDEKGPDINALRVLASKLVNERGALTWHPRLLVTVGGSIEPLLAETTEHDHESRQIEVELSVSECEVCEVMPGQWRHRQFSGNRRMPTQDGLPDVGADEDAGYGREDHKKMTALIDDTPANRAALNAIVAGFTALREKLRKLLAPETINANLLNIADTARLLPAPEPVPAKKRKGR